MIWDNLKFTKALTQIKCGNIRCISGTFEKMKIILVASTVHPLISRFLGAARISKERK